MSGCHGNGRSVGIQVVVGFCHGQSSAQQTVRLGQLQTGVGRCPIAFEELCERLRGRTQGVLINREVERFLVDGGRARRLRWYMGDERVFECL